MKIIHLSDFHLGKRVNEYSLLEEQVPGEKKNQRDGEKEKLRFPSSFLPLASLIRKQKQIEKQKLRKRKAITTPC